ncbi:MAG: FAD-binding oxidoreductase, partial [Gammaproteobacteria bacterium]|nr:FAD-binding oxidoreductase [Gammaproteobacteria bacterium]
MAQQNNPYYTSTTEQASNYPTLDKQIEGDVCVVGGGYAGLSSAIHLAKTGLDVVLLEAHTIANGASGRNGGHLSPMAVHGPIGLEKVVGVENARKIWDLSEAAKRLVNGLIQENGIQCDTKSGFMIAAASAEDAKELSAEVKRFREDYQYETVQKVSKSEISEMFGTDIYHGGLYDPSIIRVNPLQFAHGMANTAKAAGVKIFEQSEVLQYSADSNVIVKTSRGQV